MSKETVRQSCKTQRGNAGSTVDAAFGETNVTEERQGGRITR